MTRYCRCGCGPFRAARWRPYRTYACKRRTEKRERRGAKPKGHPMARAGADPGYGRDWKAKAEAVRIAWGRRCAYCGRPECENVTKAGKARKLAVDHVKPRRLFESAEDFDASANLAPACLRCHAAKGSNAERKYVQTGDRTGMRRYEMLAAAGPA